MKKITLALFAAVSAFTGAFGQANITFTAPSVNASTQVRLPNGTVADRSLKGCMLITQPELTALTASVVNSMGIILLDGTDPVAAQGSFSIYVSNTTDLTNQKIAGGYAAAISNMTMVYGGAVTIPTVINTVTNINFPTINQYTYTGGGLYICYAYEQTSTTTNTFPATWAANNSMTNGCATSSSNTANGAPDQLTATNFRPSWIFGAANTATNEVSVVDAYIDGKYPKLGGAGSVATAMIKNGSINSLSNISVSLTAGAPNAFQDVQMIPSLAAGQTTVVTFNAFNPTTNGLTNLTVSVGADQNVANNQVVIQQSVTCNEAALHPPVAAGNYTSQGYGAGASASGIIYSFGYTAPANGSLTAVRLVIPGFSNAQNLGKQLWAVLLDNAGNIIATGNTVTINNAMLNVFSNWTFPAGAGNVVVANNDYFIGIAMPANQYFPVGNMAFTNTPVSGYYQHSILGGNILPINYGHLSLEGVFSFDDYIIAASATKTVVCKNGSEPVTITAMGANNYTWTPASIGSNTNTISWVPTVGGAGTATQVTVYGTYTAPNTAGCSSNTVAITFSLLTCTGLNDNAMTEVKLFPNPTNSGKTVISGMTGVTSITVFNNLGQAVLRKSVSTESVELDLSSLPAGNYLVKLTDAANESRTIKIVNQN